MQYFLCDVLSEGYSEHCRTYRMERLVKIVNGFQRLTVLAKRFVLELLGGVLITPLVNQGRVINDTHREKLVLY